MMGCSNKAEIPANVKVSGETTVRVVHQIEVSVEMQNVFTDECRTELGEDAPTEALDLCRDKKVTDYINKFLDILNQQETK